MAKIFDDQYSKEEAARRFEAALRGARLVGHKPMTEMRVGKPKTSRATRGGQKKPRSQAKKG
jgi:hypothetical protein